MKKTINYLKAINTNWVFYPFFAFLSFFMCRQSAFAPFNISGMRVDDCVFYYIGKAMTNGQMPYRDIFDHKGPTLHLFNWLGASIAGRTGIWIIAMILMFVTFLFAYKACRNFTSPFASFFTIIAIAFIWVPSYGPGNKVEEYAIPFIFIALYLFTCYFKNNYTFKKSQLFMLGFTFICVFMLRPNMVALWLVFCLSIIAMEIYKKRYENIFKYIGFFILGTLIYLIPVMTWIISTGTLKDFLYQFFTFNVLYTRSTTGVINLLVVIKYFASNLLLHGFALIIIYTFYVIFFGKFVFRKKDARPDYVKVNFVLIYGIYTLLSFALMIMSLRPYAHYFMPFLACIVIPYAMSIDAVTDFISKFKLFRNKNIVRVVIAILILLSLHSLILEHNAIVQERKTETEEYKTLMNVSEIVKENTSPNDKISVFGNATKFYIWSDRLSFSKYIYQLPASDVDPSVSKGYIADFKASPPIILIIAGIGEYNKAYDTEIVKFLEEFKEEHYTLLDTVNRTEIYILNERVKAQT